MLSKIGVASVAKLFYESPMQTSRNQKLVELFTFLEGILPASTILVVGAGSSGFDPETLSSNAEAIHLCEPDNGRAHKLKMRHKLLRQVHVHNCLIADKTGPTNFHLTSLEAADGLVNPEQLRSVWKNIRLEKQFELDAKTIQSFVKELGSEATPDWLIVDCLRAPDILAAAGSLVEEVDVIVLKLTSANNKSENLLYSTGQAYLKALNCLAEFRLVTTLSSGYSAVFHKVYVRDWKHKAAIDLTEQIQTLEASEQTAMSELEAVQIEIRNTENELNSAKAELKNLRVLSEKIQVVEALEQSAKSSLASAQAEIQALKNELSISNADYRNLEEKFQSIESQASGDKDRLLKEKRLLENNLENAREKYRELAEQRLSEEEQWKQILARLEKMVNSEITAEVSKKEIRMREISKFAERTKTPSNKHRKNKQESGDK